MKIIAILLAVAAPVAARAQDRSIASIWTIEPGLVPSEELSLAGGEVVLEQRLLPIGLAELTEPLAGLGKNSLPAGTQLVQLRTGTGAIYCVPEVPKQKLMGASFLPCLVDDQKDGRFEGWFNAISETKGLLSLNAKRPKTLRPATAAYAVRDPAAMTLKCTVAIERRNYFNLYSLESFMVRFGCANAFERLTTPINFPSTDMPKELTVMGARFTALSEADGKMRVKVSAPMPRQPFGVAKTTTYSFY